MGTRRYRRWRRNALLTAVSIAVLAVPAAAGAAADVGLVAVSAPGAPAVVAISSDGATRTVVTGGGLMAPSGLASLGPGAALIADRGSSSARGTLWRLEETAAGATLNPAAAAGALDQPLAVAVSPDGSYLVTDDRDRGPLSGAVLRVDPTTGVVSTIASGWPLQEPNGIAVEPSGTLLVSDRFAGLLRVSPQTGRVSRVARAWAIGRAAGLALVDSGALIPVLSGRRPRVVLVDPTSGRVTVESEGPPLDRPVAVASRPEGGALLLDRGTPGVFAVGLAPASSLTLLGTAPVLARGTAVTAWEAAPAPAPVPTPAPAPAPALPPETPLPPSPTLQAAEAVAPPVTLGPVSITPRAFRAARGGPAVIAQASGARMAFELSAATRVRITIHACRSRGARPRCRRTRRLAGKVFITGRPGVNVTRLTGRLAGRPLPAGDYRLFAKAEQSDGSFGPSSQQVFTILP